MLALFAALSLSRAPAFTWPPRYTIRGTWNVPYTNLSNPIVVSHEPDRQYASQLNGVEQIWNTLPEAHFHRKIVGAGDKFICYGYNKTAADWDIEITHFLPDPAGFVTKDGTYTYRGKVCKLHEKTLDGGKTQTWKMYTEVSTGYPVAYVAQAVSLFHSHYDLYVLNIDEFIPEALPGVWQLPEICNSPNLEVDPYPGNGFNLFFPGPDAVPNKKRVGKFAHMDPQKWLKSITRDREITRKRKLLRGDLEDKCKQYDPFGDTGTLPYEFSWRKVSPVVVGPPRDQVACGSCWAFGTAEIIESALALKTKKFQEVSVNQILDCTWDNGNSGCQGGEVNHALTSMMNHNLEIAYERDYPYIGVSGMCFNDTKFYKPAGKIKACWHIPRTKEAIKRALLKYGPLGIGINVAASMSFYNGGAYNDTACTGAQDDLVHAVVLTGWKMVDGVECWEVKNSWSTYWGDEGYVYIQAVHQEWNCGVTTDAVAVEVEAYDQ